MHINPDHYLDTPLGRIWTTETNNKAWKQCYIELQNALSTRVDIKRIYILIGCQGSGKTTWVKSNADHLRQDIIFDAILVKQSERKPILDLAKKYRKLCLAVWFRTPLQTCIERNSKRPIDQIVNIEALTNVFYALEKPNLNEGFNHIIEIELK